MTIEMVRSVRLPDRRRVAAGEVLENPGRELEKLLLAGDKSGPYGREYDPAHPWKGEGESIGGGGDSSAAELAALQSVVREIAAKLADGDRLTKRAAAEALLAQAGGDAGPADEESGDD